MAPETMMAIELPYGLANFMDECYYCGAPADSIDHVTPQTIKTMCGFEFENPVTARTETVKACRECNSSLGGRFFETLADRKVAAKDHIRRKYKKYLRIPQWTPEELAELEPVVGQFDCDWMNSGAYDELWPSDQSRRKPL